MEEKSGNRNQVVHIAASHTDLPVMEGEFFEYIRLSVCDWAMVRAETYP